MGIANESREIGPGGSLLVAHTLFTYEWTDSVAPEPEGSSPCSQQPATGPYPEPPESTKHQTPS
jgi:hypothetical protein